MAGCGCGDGGCRSGDDAYWKALLWAFLVNIAFFGIETVGAFQSGSSSLLADAVDFLGDAVNYGASLLVTGMAVIWSTRLAMVKGAVMFSWGLFVLGRAAWMAMQGGVPEASTMTLLSILALIANVGVAVMLYRHRNGDANRRAVWLCSRNDALGNVAVLLAAQGVLLTGRGWPDLAAACLLAGLGLSSGLSVLRRAWREARRPPQAGHQGAGGAGGVSG